MPETRDPLRDRAGALAAAGAVTVAVVAALRRQQRRDTNTVVADGDPGPPQELRVPEVHRPTAQDVLATLQHALPLKLPALLPPTRGGAAPVDPAALLGGAEAAAAQLVYPGNRLGVEAGFRGVVLGDLRANIARELAAAAAMPGSPPHPLRSPSDGWWQAEQVAARLEAHRHAELYGMAAATDLPAVLRARLRGVAAPVLGLTTGHWAQVSMNLWVGASSGSLHYDERDNVLLQLAGTKRVVLFPIEHAGPACRMHAVLSRLPNHSSYNQSFLTAAARAGNPALAVAPHYEVELRPGDALVIPAGVPHAPLGSLDSVSLNLFLKDGPEPSPRSRWLRARFHLSVAARSVFSLKLPHIGGGTLRFQKAAAKEVAAVAGGGGGRGDKGQSQGQGQGQPQQTSAVPCPAPGAVALVTGASQGIGLALSRLLVGAGWRVVALCREPSADLQDVAAHPGAGADAQTGGLEVAPGVDLRAPAPAVAAAVDRALAGRPVALLVHCAGIGSADALDELVSEGGFERPEQQYRVHCLAPLALATHLAQSAQLMRAGTVVLLGSNLGSVALAAAGPQRFVGYRLSKCAANMGLVLLAQRLRPLSVVVVGVHPGATHTAMTRAAVGADVASTLRPPTEAAAAVLRVAAQATLEQSGGLWKAPTDTTAAVEAAPSVPW